MISSFKFKGYWKTTILFAKILLKIRKIYGGAKKLQEAIKKKK